MVAECRDRYPMAPCRLEDRRLRFGADRLVVDVESNHRLPSVVGRVVQRVDIILQVPHLVVQEGVFRQEQATEGSHDYPCVTATAW